MDAKNGIFVRTPQGYDAFVPNPLPPGIDWSSNLVNALSEADMLIGRLAGEGARLPNPHILMRPFIRREAVMSSSIEGTQSTLGELLASEAGAHVERSPEDLREVANYVVALEYGIKRLNQLPLSLRLILELHAKLMRGVRGGTATPGEFRRSQNWIGRPGSTIQNASYIPPPPIEMMDCLGKWEIFLHDRTLPTLIQIALAHYQFEAIHPFLDGNGRMGRLLITLFLIERAILPTPLLYLSAFFEASRDDYYNSLKQITLNDDWEGWLIYFLNGVARQSEDALGRAERINELIIQWQKEVSGLSSKVSHRLIDSIAANPFLMIRKVADTMGVAYTTVERAVEKLVELKILTQTSSGKRDRVFCAKQILDILEEPPLITALLK